MTKSSGQPRPFVIGVTGRIACGKSTVLAALRDKGVETIDADQNYHELIRHGLPLWKTLSDAFGPEIVGPDGEIDRRALGRIVFGNPDLLRKLDELTHPAIVTAIERRIADSHADVIAIDAVKLVESGMDRACDVVWRVACDPKTQVDRLIERNGFSREEADRRVTAQQVSPHSLRPETIVENNGDLDTLRRRVDAAWLAASNARASRIL